MEKQFPEFSAVLFDMDGVLIDSEVVMLHAAMEGFQPFGIDATPEDFARYKEMALAKGFRHVASAPLARSSYKAWEVLEDVHDLY